MTELELKARAYDLIAQIQYLQSELVRINEELAKRTDDTQKQEKKK